MERAIVTQDLFKTWWDPRQYCFDDDRLEHTKGKTSFPATLPNSVRSWDPPKPHDSYRRDTVPLMVAEVLVHEQHPRRLLSASRYWECQAGNSRCHEHQVCARHCANSLYRSNPFTPHTQTNKDYRIVLSSQHEVFDFILNNHMC